MVSTFETRLAVFQASRLPGMSIASEVVTRDAMVMLGDSSVSDFLQTYIYTDKDVLDVHTVCEDGKTASTSSSTRESIVPIPVSDPRVTPSDKLPTSELICNRLMWDEQYREHEYSVVYEDRFAGMQEQSVTTFRAGKSDVQNDAFVPWHRVWEFKHKGVLVWDRKNRLSTIFGIDSPASVDEEKSSKKKKEKPRSRSNSKSSRSKSPSNRKSPRGGNSKPKSPRT
jgi:uncharacterized protein (UPF0248 family)